jgi:hypothetical protein
MKIAPREVGLLDNGYCWLAISRWMIRWLRRHLSPEQWRSFHVQDVGDKSAHMLAGRAGRWAARAIDLERRLGITSIFVTYDQVDALDEGGLDAGTEPDEA